MNVVNNCYWTLSKEKDDIKIKFNDCSYSDIRKLIKEEYKEMRISDFLPLLKTVTIFILADLGLYLDLENTLKKDEAFDQDEVKIYLMKMKQKEPLAIYYEGIEDIAKALKIWQEIGDDRAITKTIDIIGSTNLPRADLFKYCRWVIKEKPDQVIKIMLQYEKTSLSPEIVIDFLRD